MVFVEKNTQGIVFAFHRRKYRGLPFVSLFRLPLKRCYAGRGILMNVGEEEIALVFREHFLFKLKRDGERI